MRAAHAGLVALTLASGCVRFGYDVPRVPADHTPDASRNDAAAPRRTDGEVADAAPGTDSGSDGSAAPTAGATGEAGVAGAGAGSAGSSGAGSGATASDDAGADIDEMIGDAGLRVSDILGFYSGDWGDMVLRKHDDEIWGVYPRDSGTIVGKITGDGVFVGWWSQLPSRADADAGEVEFRWSGTSGTPIALDGRWRYGTTGDWYENWDIGLVTDREAPSELIARFDMPSEFIRHP